MVGKGLCLLMLITSSTKTYYNIWGISSLRVAKTSSRNFALSVTVRESVPEAKSYGQLIWLKLSTEVGCDEISQKSVWLSSLTSSSVVFAGDGWVRLIFFSFDHQKSSLQGGILKLPFNSIGKWSCQMNLTMDYTMQLSVHAC